IQLLYFSRPATRLDSTRSKVLLAALVLPAYVPILTFGSPWLVMPSFVAASVLLTLRARLAWPLFCLVGLSVAWLYALYGNKFLSTVYTTLATVAYGLIFCLLAPLVR